jgi:hypothetical protein
MPGSRFERISRFSVRRILFVASLYDYFLLEEDGRLADHLASSGGAPPRLFHVTGGAAALQALRDEPFDMVVVLMRLGDMEPVAFGRSAKDLRPGIPVALLAGNTPELPRLAANLDPSAVDFLFAWTGDGSILLGIVRLVEDLVNAPEDCVREGVPALLLVEDSVLFYSRYLHEMHRMVDSLMAGTLASAAPGPAQRALRARARPKVLLATDWERAVTMMDSYGPALLGLVTDQSLPRGGASDPSAGLALLHEASERLPGLPAILQTSEEGSGRTASELGAVLVCKSSPLLLKELRGELERSFGFGPMVLEDPASGRRDEVENVEALFLAIDRAPAGAVLSAVRSGALDRWLRARTELGLAAALAGVDVRGDPETARSALSDAARAWRRESRRGSVPPYSRAFFEDYARFCRIGAGSIGGKGRGLAFIDRIMTSGLDPSEFPGVDLGIPRTLVLTTEVFEDFMDQNDLLGFAVSGERDLAVTGRFLKADLPPTVLGDLRDFLRTVDSPLAVRSSSLLEDALYQPFAGIYATKMLPNNQVSFDDRFRSFVSAIKLVYASTYLRQARAYIESTNHRPEEERMAVLVQSVVGRRHGDFFYPHFSGVGRSYDYYPAGLARPEDGVVNLALGLGKTIVDGGLSLRFTPKYPRVLPQFTGVREMLGLSQKRLWAVDMRVGAGSGLEEEEDQFLAGLDMAEAERNGILDWTASTWSPQDERLYDGITRDGPRVVDFSHVLKNEVFPLARLADRLLRMGRDAMNCPVEIEFAGVLGGRSALPGEFSLLQIRPMVAGDELVTVDLEDDAGGDVLCRTARVLGNGMRSDISDILVVMPETFDASRTREMAREIDGLNQLLARERRPYLLVGPGRWGSSDPWLGIPVNWSQISGVKAIVEVTLPGMNVDPSQGSHFFQNMTSLRIGYFSVSHDRAGESLDWGWLASLEAERSTAHVRHLRLPSALRVMIDGRSGKGLILRP